MKATLENIIRNIPEDIEQRPLTVQQMAFLLRVIRNICTELLKHLPE